MFLARAVTRAKWIPKNGHLGSEIPADAVTANLRTQGNTLSFWQGDLASQDSVNDVALAIAAGRERVDKVELVWITRDDLLDDGLSLIETEGRTPVSDLVSRHIDVCDLDYIRLGTVAKRVVTAIESSRYTRLTLGKVRGLLTSAVADERIDLEDLEERVREDVLRSLAPRRS